MSGDLPLQGLMQQRHAHSHSGEYLEVLGKRAAAQWSSGEYKTLTDAVTETVKQAQLSPEQVKRVVEFANTSAFLVEFKKEGATHHVVDFPGGPADPSEILKDLNDGGGGSVFDRGTGDYNSPPSGEAATKVASDKAEEELVGLFGQTAQELPYENPNAEVIELKDKLSSASEHLTAQISGLEVAYAELGDRLFHQVKQAALSGTSLGEVLQAWQTVAPSDDYIKVAFTLLTPRLLRNGVFPSVGAMTASVDKTASARIVNEEHPLVTEFGEFCETLSKLAELRAARTEVNENLASLQGYIKLAAGGAVGKVWSAAGRAGKAVSPFVRAAAGDTAGDLAERTPQAALLLGGAALASDANQRIENSQSLPAQAARGAKHFVLRHTPGTLENQIHQMELRQP